jgi:hypothetical protein
MGLKITKIYHSEIPALAGGMPAGAATYCRASLIRLMNVEKIVQIERMAGWHAPPYGSDVGVPALAGERPHTG